MWKESILKLLKLDNLVNNLTGYVETRVELMKLEVREELAKAMAKLSVLVVLISVATLFVLFFSVTLALVLANFVGILGGFAIVAGIYLLLTVIVLMMRAGISEALEKKLLEQLRKK
jgi:Putative Actinobacterial Holin-X, holin superfamily III